MTDGKDQEQTGRHQSADRDPADLQTIRKTYKTLREKDRLYRIYREISRKWETTGTSQTDNPYKDMQPQTDNRRMSRHTDQQTYIQNQIHKNILFWIRGWTSAFPAHSPRRSVSSLPVPMLWDSQTEQEPPRSCLGRAS